MSNPQRDGSTSDEQDNNTARPSHDPSQLDVNESLIETQREMPKVKLTEDDIIPNPAPEPDSTMAEQQIPTESTAKIHPEDIRAVEGELQNASPPQRSASDTTVRAGSSWAEPSDVDFVEDITWTHPRHTGRHQLSGDVIQASELVARRSRANIDETQRTSRHKYCPYVYNRGNSPGDSLLRRNLFAHTPHRVIELLTQASTITYPTPTYTALSWPTPTYLTLPRPAIAYPPPIRQIPAASSLVQAQNIHQILNSYFPYHIPPQIRHSSPPSLQNFQTSSLYTSSSSLKLIPLVRPEAHRYRPFNNHQQSTTSLPHNVKPLDLSVPIKPVPTFLPIPPSLPTSGVYSGSAGTPTPNRCSPSTHTVASNVVDIQSSNLLQFLNTGNETTTYQNVSRASSSNYSLNQTTHQRQPYHQSQAPPDLLEHQQYRLWPLGDLVDIDTEELGTTIYDGWLNSQSPNSTVVPDALQTPAPIPTTSSVIIVPVPFLTSATPSHTTPTPEKAKHAKD